MPYRIVSLTDPTVCIASFAFRIDAVAFLSLVNNADYVLVVPDSEVQPCL